MSSNDGRANVIFMMQLSTREVEKIVAIVFDVHTDDMLALRARLENLRKKGCPSGLATGRGKVAKFDFQQLTQLSLALALIDAGLSPEYAVIAVEDMDDVARCFALLGAERLCHDELGHALVVGFWPMEASVIALCSVHRLLGNPGDQAIRVPTWAISSSHGGPQPSDTGLSAAHIDFGTLFIRLVSAIAGISGHDGIELATALLDRSEDYVVHS